MPASIFNGDAVKILKNKLRFKDGSEITSTDVVTGPASSTDNTLPRFDGTSGQNLQTSGVTVDDSDNVTIPGNLTVNGTTTTINSTTVDVIDANITINKGGNQVTADSNDAGITVEMSDATNALVHYDSTATSKFKVGALGATVEIADISSSQALTNKTIDSDLNTITNIVNADIKAAAAIDYSKLNLTGNIVDADISGSAAIAYSKLNLTTSIVNTDINAAAAIEYSKLNLATSIVNADISGLAAIEYSKLNLATSIVNADISASAAIEYSKLNLATSIVNADISASAAIDYSKLNLATSIVNADINAAAAIAYSKLNLSGSVLNADISSSTTIDASKLEIFNVNTVNTATNAAVNSTYLVQSNSGAITVTLPAPAVDAFVVIKDRDGNATANNITVARNASESIENVAGNYTMDSNGESKTFVSDGTNWFVL